MPVYATPASNPTAQCCDDGSDSATPSPVPSDGEIIIVPEIPMVNGVANLRQMKSVYLTGCQCVTIEWIMRNKLGNPIDLSSLFPVSSSSVSSSTSSESSNASSATADPYTVKLRFREYITQGDQNKPFYEIDGVVQDAANGVVHFVIPKTNTLVPGVFFAEAAVLDTDAACLLFSNYFYLVAERGLWSTLDPTLTAGAAGPPTIMEIRLHLRDSSSDESFLLDNLMFTDAEIALATVRPIQYWNEIPPPVGIFDSHSFPYRFHWLDAICSGLFFMAAEQYRRNNLKYAAAGITLNDQDKEPNYEKAAVRYRQAFEEFVLRKKAEINLSGAYSTLGSTYGAVSSANPGFPGGRYRM